jgi:hypothetical protein
LILVDQRREENIYMAKLAEQAERFEERVDFMEKVAESVESVKLTVEADLETGDRNPLHAPGGGRDWHPLPDLAAHLWGRRG